MNRKRLVAWILILLIALTFVAMLITLLMGMLKVFMAIGTGLVILLLVSWLLIRWNKKQGEEEEKNEKRG